MQFTRSLGPIVAITLALTLAACGNPAMEVVPTPTPRDAALERLNQSQEEAEAVTSTETGAVAETSTEMQTDTEASDAAGNGGDGEQIFAAQGCVACHMLEGESVIVGPNLSRIGATAAERVTASDYTGEATTAEEYIHESIVNPNVYIVPDFVAAMPATYEQTIPPDELDQLVSYLASLE